MLSTSEDLKPCSHPTTCHINFATRPSGDLNPHAPLGYGSIAKEQGVGAPELFAVSTNTFSSRLTCLRALASANAALPINRLPTEILIEIFRQTALSREACDPPWGWLQLLLVCRYWFAVGVTTSTLWSDVTSHRAKPISMDFLSLCLARSKQVPFAASFGSRLAMSRITALEAHLYRLNALELYEIPPRDVARFFRTAKPCIIYPAMTSLLMTKSYPQAPADTFVCAPVVLSAKRFPTLATLSLWRIVPDATSSIFPNLTTLRLACFTISFATLGQMLSQCMNLRKLDLQHILDTSPAADVNPGIQQYAPVLLPKLRAVKLATETFGKLLKVMSLLPLSPTVSKRYSITGFPYLADTHDKEIEGMKHLGRRLPSFFSTPVETVSVSFLATNTVLSLVHGAGTLVVKYHAPAAHSATPNPGLSDACAVLHAVAPEVRNLHVRYGSSAAAEAGWADALMLFPRLHTLTVEGDGVHKGGDRLVRALQPQVRVREAACRTDAGVGESEESLLCPELRCVKVRGFVFDINVQEAIIEETGNVIWVREKLQRTLEKVDIRVDDILEEWGSGPGVHFRLPVGVAGVLWCQ